MGLFKKRSILEGLNAYLNDNNDEEVANDYRVIFSKVLDEYDWQQGNRTKLSQRLDYKFSSYDKGNHSMIDSLRKGQWRFYLRTTVSIKEELEKIRIPNLLIKDKAKDYSQKIYNTLETLAIKYFNKNDK